MIETFYVIKCIHKLIVSPSTGFRFHVKVLFLVSSINCRSEFLKMEFEVKQNISFFHKYVSNLNSPCETYEIILYINMLQSWYFTPTNFI